MILVSNDDGHASSGIAALSDALESLGEVWVVAPEGERSATSHSITLHKPLRVRQLRERRYWCSGMPADCVYVAINHLLPRKPDLMVSGINRGANLGDDVSYSGTVGAAMEATLLGVPSIAVSLTGVSRPAGYEGAVTLTLTLAEQVLASGLPALTLLNMNVPDGYDPARGLRATKLGRRHYGRVVEERKDPRGRDYFWIGGTRPVFIDTPGSDVNANAEGIASVTPVLVDASAHAFVDTLGSWQGVDPAP